MVCHTMRGIRIAVKVRIAILTYSGFCKGGAYNG